MASECENVLLASQAATCGQQFSFSLFQLLLLRLLAAACCMTKKSVTQLVSQCYPIPSTRPDADDDAKSGLLRYFYLATGFGIRNWPTAAARDRCLASHSSLGLGKTLRNSLSLWMAEWRCIQMRFAIRDLRFCKLLAAWSSNLANSCEFSFLLHSSKLFFFSSQQQRR